MFIIVTVVTIWFVTNEASEPCMSLLLWSQFGCYCGHNWAGDRLLNDVCHCHCDHRCPCDQTQDSHSQTALPELKQKEVILTVKGGCALQHFAWDCGAVCMSHTRPVSLDLQ